MHGKVIIVLQILISIGCLSLFSIVTAHIFIGLISSVCRPPHPNAENVLIVSLFNTMASLNYIKNKFSLSDW
jgi:hypothetical protein